MAENDIILRTARNIARQRRQLKITQKEMARLLSLTTETVCRLEKGRHDFSLRRLQQFADIFSCRVIDLLRRLPPCPSRPARHPDGSSAPGAPPAGHRIPAS